MEKLYYTAKEVAEMLDVSVSHAYKVIREANKELSSKGFYVRAGRVSRKYLDSKVYDLRCCGLMYENQRLQEENKSLKELLEKVYDFMKQFVIDGVNLLEKFMESVGKVMERLSPKTK